MKTLYKALAEFQQEVPNIYKNSEGYGYKFADLGEINDVIKPLLQKYGLGYVQPIEGNAIKTIIFHVESGESIESLANIPQNVQLAKMNDFQVLGSAITYLRRYSLSSMLGLVTDEDADASGDQVKLQATKEIRNRTEEVNAGAFSMGELDSETLVRAKTIINTELEAQDLTSAIQKKSFVTKVIGKATIETIDEANLVMDQLENEK